MPLHDVRYWLLDVFYRYLTVQVLNLSSSSLIRVYLRMRVKLVEIPQALDFIEKFFRLTRPSEITIVVRSASNSATPTRMVNNMANFTVPTANTVKSKDEIEWQNVEPSSLPKVLETKYLALRKAMEALVAAKEDFENDFSGACTVDAGHKMIFSYRYGLACGVVPEKISTSKGKVSFGSLAKPSKK